MPKEARRSAEADQLLAVAGELAACEKSADLEGPLRALQRLLGADALGSGELRAQPSAAMDILPQVTLPAAFDAESLSYMANHWDEHPCLVRQLAGPEPSPLRLGDFLSQRSLRRRGIYPGYRRLGLRDEIAVQVHWEEGRMACVTAHRSAIGFGERERALLTRLLPHLRAARTRIETKRRAERRLELLEAGLEQSGTATALIAPGGRIVAASGACERLLERWFGRSRQGGALPEELLAWRRAERRRAGSAPLRLASDGDTLEVRASNLDEGWLLLLRVRAQVPPAASALAAALPITQRQAEVLELISRGLADAAIANQLGISVRTVGHHVQHLLARLEVPGRTAAAALAFEVV